MTISNTDLLATLKPYLANEYDGFKGGLDEASDKGEFILSCLKAIENNHDFYAKNKNNPSVTDNSFLYGPLKVSLIEPEKTLFASKNLNDKEIEMAKLFTRLRTLKMVVNTVIKEPTYCRHETKALIIKLSTSLSQEFKGLAIVKTHQFSINGQVITNIDDAHNVIQRAYAEGAIARQQFHHSKDYLWIIMGVGFISAVKSMDSDNDIIKIGAPIICILAGLALIFSLARMSVKTLAATSLDDHYAPPSNTSHTDINKDDVNLHKFFLPKRDKIERITHQVAMPINDVDGSKKVI